MKNRKLKFASVPWILALSIVLFACGDDDSVTPNTGPVALFTALPTSGTVGDEITFTDQSGDEDGEIIRWNWDFGDGNTSAEQNPTHTYERAGDYMVDLWVYDDREDSASYSLSVSINAFSELWVEAIGTATISPSAPAVGSDGTLYFGSQDFNVYAVDPSDGTVKWSYTTAGRVRSRPAIGSDGTIYIPSQDNNLYALSSSGSLLWSFETGGFFDSSPAIGADGTIYVGADDSKLYALNTSGTEQWSFEAGARIRCDAVVTTSAVYFASEDAKLYSLSLSGTENWSFEVSARVVASPALDSDGTIYVGDDAGEFYAINPDGTQKWKFSTADNNPFELGT